MRHHFLFRLAISHDDFLVLETVPEFIRNLHGRVRSVVRNVSEKWPVPIFLHEFHGFVRKIVDEEALALYDLAIGLERRGKVVAPMAGSEPIVFVKPATIRMVRVLHSIVPLAKSSVA